MNAVVIVPTFDRPEMLWLCLEHIAACPEAKHQDVRVCVDRRNSIAAPLTELAQLQDRYSALNVSLRFTPRHTHHGNSFNVLTALRQAYADDAEFDRFFLVEDDVLVSPEFFRWHNRVECQESPAASIGVRDPGHGAYASLGVCLPRTTVAAILEHAVLAYFRDMRGYCRFAFPPSPFDCEQDGLIARVLAGQRVAWADPPVCSHVGWYGYHRTKTRRPTGTLEERVAQVKAAITDPRALAALAGRPDVTLATETNAGTYTLSTVPGAVA